MAFPGKQNILSLTKSGEWEFVTASLICPVLLNSSIYIPSCSLKHSFSPEMRLFVEKEHEVNGSFHFPADKILDWEHLKYSFITL